MRKFAFVIGIIVGVIVVPRMADASPIGTNGCALNAIGISECDIYVDPDVNGSSDLGAAEGNLGTYLPGYLVVLNASANLGNGLDVADVAHILVIQDQLFQLYSQTATTVFSGLFDNVFASVLQGVNPGQRVGCPAIPTGVPTIDGVGYCTNADLIALDQTIAWGDPVFGGLDTLRIHTALPNDTQPQPEPVPEPGTLTLLGIGGAAAAIRRRRAAAR